MPTAAVMFGGRPRVSSGSAMTSPGSMRGWKMIFLVWSRSSVITAARPTSEPVPAVVGTATTGAMPSTSTRVYQSSRPIWDFEDREDWYTRVDVDGMAAVVAVPTTAGTGSEVGRASVITDTRDHTKKIIFHPRMLPGRVIADPELTLGLPPNITAAVGMDALAHNLEAFCSPFYHPIAQGVALEGMRLIRKWLPAACRRGDDVTARAHMLVASTMGAAAFQKGLGAMHAMSHPCGAVLDTHHGLTNAVVMPYVLVFNRPAIEEKMTALARYLGLPAPSFGSVLDWVLDLREAIGIPADLAALGVAEDQIGQLAAMAVADPSVGGNPIPLTRANLTTLFLNAVRGRIE